MCDTNLPRSSGDVWAIPAECAEHKAHERELIQCLKLARSVYAAWQLCEQNHLVQEYHRAVDAAMQDLLTYSIETYHSGITPEDVERIFAETERCSEFEYLKNLKRGAVPVALVRVILYRDKVSFNPHNVPCWNRFANHYGRHILNHGGRFGP